jgi:hypothetical protein
MPPIAEREATVEDVVLGKYRSVAKIGNEVYRELALKEVQSGYHSLTVEKKRESRNEIINALLAQRRLFFDNQSGVTVPANRDLVDYRLSGLMRVMSANLKKDLEKYMGSVITSLKGAAVDIRGERGTEIVAGVHGGVLHFEGPVVTYLKHLAEVAATISAKELSTVRDSHVDVVRKRSLYYTLCRGTESTLGLYSNSNGRGFPTKSSMSKKTLEKRISQEAAATTAIKTFIATLYSLPTPEVVTYQLGYMESKVSVPQRPHCDYINRGLAREVSALSFLPLTKAGMYLQVWNERESLMGMVLYVPFGSMLVLRGDVIHGGGFMSDNNGNPRLHMYVQLKGNRFDLVPNNDYRVAEDLDLTMNEDVIDPFVSK